MPDNLERLKLYEGLDVDRVVFTLPAEKADELMPIIDNWSELKRRSWEAEAYFLALLIDGALAGAIYALIALAFVLVYKASSMINFALGEWIMVGALLAGLGRHVLQLGAVGALLFAGLGMIVLATCFNHLVVRHLVARPAISAIMVTLGLGMIMRSVAPQLLANVPAMIPPSMQSVTLGEIVSPPTSRWPQASRCCAPRRSAPSTLQPDRHRAPRHGRRSAGGDVGRYRRRPAPAVRLGADRRGRGDRGRAVGIRRRQRLRRWRWSD